MNPYVGVTDNDWFSFLGQLPGVDEVNFRQQGGTHKYQALKPEEHLLLKPHSAENLSGAQQGWLADR